MLLSMEGCLMPAGTPVQLRLQENDRDLLDQYRREQSNPPSRAQAARELMLRALVDRMSDAQSASAAR